MKPKVRNLCARTVQSMWGWVSAVGGVGPQDPCGRKFAAMGLGSVIAFPPAGIINEQWIRIGSGVLIGPHVSMSAGMYQEYLSPEQGWVIDIADRVNIGRMSSIIARERVVIGEDTTCGPQVYITDHNHGYDDPFVPVAHQWPRTDPVEIGRGCWLGVGAIILPGTRLGDNVVVAGGSVVRGAFPDRCVVAGVPAKVVRRWTDDGWDPPLEPRRTSIAPGWPGGPPAPLK